MGLVLVGCSSDVFEEDESLEVREDAVTSTVRTAETTLDVSYYPRSASDKAVILYQEDGKNASVWDNHIPRFQRNVNVVTFTPRDTASIESSMIALKGFLDRRDFSVSDVYVVVVGQMYQDDDLAGVFLVGLDDVSRDNQIVFQKSGDTFSQSVEDDILSFME